MFKHVPNILTIIRFLLIPFIIFYIFLIYQFKNKDVKYVEFFLF